MYTCLTKDFPMRYGPEGRGFESLMVRQRHRQSRCLFSSPRDSEPVADARFPPACLRMQNRCGKLAIPSLRSLRIPHGTRRHRQSRCLFSSLRDSEPVADAHQQSPAKGLYGFFCGVRLGVPAENPQDFTWGIISGAPVGGERGTIYSHVKGKYPDKNKKERERSFLCCD